MPGFRGDGIGRGGAVVLARVPGGFAGFAVVPLIAVRSLGFHFKGGLFALSHGDRFRLAGDRQGFLHCDMQGKNDGIISSAVIGIGHFSAVLHRQQMAVHGAAGPIRCLGQAEARQGGQIEFPVLRGNVNHIVPRRIIPADQVRVLAHV